MSSRTPDRLRKELEDMRHHLDSKQYGHDVTEYAEDLKTVLDKDYDRRDLEKLLAFYRETFPDFYEQAPVSNVEDYLEEFEDIDTAITALEE